MRSFWAVGQFLPERVGENPHPPGAQVRGSAVVTMLFRAVVAYFAFTSGMGFSEDSCTLMRVPGQTSMVAMPLLALMKVA